MSKELIIRHNDYLDICTIQTMGVAYPLWSMSQMQSVSAGKKNNN